MPQATKNTTARKAPAKKTTGSTTSKKATPKKAVAGKTVPKKPAPKKTAAKSKPVTRTKQASATTTAKKKARTRPAPKRVKVAPEVDNKENNFEPRDFAEALFHYFKSDSLKREGSRFFNEAKRILKGESELDYGRDKRFVDPMWRENPLYKRLGQSYLAFCQAIEGVVEEDDEDPMRNLKARLLIEHITSMASPTNSLLGNPEGLKKAYETKGASLLNGVRNFVDDLVNNKGLPSQVDADELIVGEDLAVSEGAVIYRNQYLEIIQFKSTTSEVYKIPLLIMTPQINKYYFLDLAPGRSLVEYLTSQGYQVFVVSWRNPGPEHGGWQLEDYCSALVDAMEAVSEVTKSPQINTFGFCAGGITMTALLSYLNQSGMGDRVNAVSYAVTMMDFSQPSLIGILKSDYLLKFSKGSSQAMGVLDGDNLATMFTMLRPRDFIWDYWVNNYILGNPAPVFDILAWNKDSTNLPASLHKNYLDIFNDNLMTKVGGFKIHDVPVDTRKITQEAFVVGAVTDHLTPWKGCYQTTQLLGGKSEFVLSSAGHVAALVNPPGNPKSFYMRGSKPGPDADEWLEKAERHTGSWWEYWAQWASSRSGGKKRSRKTLGSRKNPVLVKAPGTYIFETP